MISFYTIDCPIAIIDGVKTMIYAREFCLTQLEGNELANCISDLDIINAYDVEAEKNGFLSTQSTIDYITTENGNTVLAEVGEEIYRDIEKSPFHPKLFEYIEKIKNHPKVIKFDGLQLVGTVENKRYEVTWNEFDGVENKVKSEIVEAINNTVAMKKVELKLNETKDQNVTVSYMNAELAPN